MREVKRVKIFYRRNEAYGFTLVELMVAMVISLILIGGTISVFLSNQQSFRSKQQLDNAQEAFRFSSQSINSVIRQGNAVGDGSTGDLLVIETTATADEGVSDCLGNPVNGTITNTYFLTANELRCRVIDGASTMEEALVENIEQMEFRFNPDTEYWTTSTTSFLDSGGVSDWSTVRSVWVRLQMQGSGLETTFISTLRAPTIALGSE